MPKTSEPDRVCMKLEDWPLPDRAAWVRATAAGKGLDESGPAAHWRPGMRESAIQGYGRFLTFLDIHKQLDRHAEPEMRVDRPTIVDYVRHLQRDCASSSVHAYVNFLRFMIRVMAPTFEAPWLDDIVRRLKARATPAHDKRARLVPAEALLDLGFEMMAQAERELQRVGFHQLELELAPAAIAPRSSARPAPRQLVRYRDGLIVAFLAAMAFRSRSLLAMRLGHHLVRDKEGYGVRLDPEDTKTGARFASRLPGFLVEAMDYYVAEIRPLLLNERESDLLWISMTGTALEAGPLYKQLVRATRERFGVALGSHMFRSCLATTVAIEDPDHVQIIMPILIHGSERPGEKYYNMAPSLDAIRRHQKLIRQMRCASRSRLRQSKRS